MSKLKDKWNGELDDLSYFSKDNIHIWIVDYVNLNNNVYVNISEVHDNLNQVEKEIFEMKIK